MKVANYNKNKPLVVSQFPFYFPPILPLPWLFLLVRKYPGDIKYVHSGILTKLRSKWKTFYTSIINDIYHHNTQIKDLQNLFLIVMSNVYDDEIKLEVFDIYCK